MARHLTAKEKTEVRRLVGEGRRDAEIAAQFGCSATTIGRVRRRGGGSEATIRAKRITIRLTSVEAESLSDLARSEGVSVSRLMRRMVRLAAGVVDFRAAEVAALRQSVGELNALARNLVQMLQLAHTGRLTWNERDGRLVAQLADRTELISQALQALRAASIRDAFVAASAFGGEMEDG